MQSKRDLLPTRSLISTEIQNDANEDSPLRAFLHSKHTGRERKDDFFDISPALFEISHTPPLVASRKTPSTCTIYKRNDNQPALSLTSNRNGAAGFFPRKNPDKYVEIGSCANKPFTQVSRLNTLQGSLSASPFESKQKDEHWRGTQEAMTSTSKEDIVSYHTLNELMEQTASTRCLLLQQTNENNTSSQPLMRSLSESAFKTILSSTKIKIKATTSVTSLINTTPVISTDVQNFRSISERKNSTFGQITGYKNPEEPQKTRIQSMLDVNLFMPLRPSEETNHSCNTVEDTKSQINSLPSCGSLENSFSEDEKHPGESIPNSSASLPVYIDVASCHRLNSSSSFDDEQRLPRVGKSHSFQTKRKFNSFQTSAVENYRQSRRSYNSFNSGDLHPTLQREGRTAGDNASGKISQTMRQELQRELQRSASRVQKFSGNF